MNKKTLKKLKVVHIDYDSGHDFGILSQTVGIREDMTEQEQRQHLIKLLEGFDFKPDKNRGYAFEVTIDHDYDNENRRFVRFVKGLGETKWQADILEQENIIIDQYIEIDSYNFFIFITQLVIHKADNNDPEYDTNDITFMKDLWAELSKIKNGSL